MQISYWTIGGFDNKRPVVDVLRDAKEMGYDGVELAFEANGVLCPETTETICRGYRETAERIGVRICSLATGYYWQKSLGHPDAAARQTVLEFTERYLQAAAWIGAETVLVIPGVVAALGNLSVPVARYGEVWDNATNGLWRALATAERLGVAIGLENVWNWFLADPAAMRAFVDQFRSPWLGVYFDAANCLINGYPDHWVRLLGHRIKAVHVKSFTRNEDGSGNLQGFGEDILQGDLDWPAFMAALRDINYAGPLTAEMLSSNLPNPQMARDTAVKLRGVINAK